MPVVPWNAGTPDRIRLSGETRWERIKNTGKVPVPSGQNHKDHDTDRWTPPGHGHKNNLPIMILRRDAYLFVTIQNDHLSGAVPVPSGQNCKDHHPGPVLSRRDRMEVADSNLRLDAYLFRTIIRSSSCCSKILQFSTTF